MIKVGDTVRFLNAVGGGKVTRIDGKVAYVEEDDGFETPVQLRECVVVAAANNARLAAESLTEEDMSTKEPVKYDKSVPAQPQAALPVIETAEGDTVNAVLAFEPQESHAISSTGFDMYFVNDSNYRMYVTVASRSNDSRDWSLRFDGLIDPNIQEFVGELSQGELNSFDRVMVQLITFKRGKDYAAQNPVCVELRIDTTKFFRLHCFRPHKYFDLPVIAYDIVKAGTPAMQFMPDAAELKRGIKEKARDIRSDTRPHPSRSSKPSNEPVVVDLHASELLDSTEGLSNSDILNVQLEHFRRTMDSMRNRPGRKVVFIHGKGEGVLRQAILKELNHRYKGCDVQDASFAEYGFGATQITIKK